MDNTSAQATAAAAAIADDIAAFIRDFVPDNGTQWERATTALTKLVHKANVDGQKYALGIVHEFLQLPVASMEKLVNIM